MDFVPRVIPASGFPQEGLIVRALSGGFIQCIGHGINGRREWHLTLSGRVDFIFYKMCINEPGCKTAIQQGTGVPETPQIPG